MSPVGPQSPMRPGWLNVRLTRKRIRLGVLTSTRPSLPSAAVSWKRHLLAGLCTQPLEPALKIAGETHQQVKTRIEMNTCLQPREWCVRTVTADNPYSGGRRRALVPSAKTKRAQPRAVRVASADIAHSASRRAGPPRGGERRWSLQGRLDHGPISTATRRWRAGAKTFVLAMS
jgi:hypothetical protein